MTITDDVETNGDGGHLRTASAKILPDTKRAMVVGARRMGWDLEDVVADAILQWLADLDTLLAADPTERLRREIAARDTRQAEVLDELRDLI